MPTLPSSGKISVSDINQAYYYPANKRMDLNSDDYRDLVSKPTPGTTISLEDAYGKTPNIKIDIGSANNNLYNVNLRSIAEETRPLLFENGEPQNMFFTFTVYGNIGSKSRSQYALRTGSWHPSVNLKLKLLPVRRADGKMLSIGVSGSASESVKIKDYVDQGTGVQKYQTVTLPVAKTSSAPFSNLEMNSPPNGLIAGMGGSGDTSGCCDCGWCHWYSPRGGSAILMETNLTIENYGIIGSGGTGGHGITQNRDNNRQGSSGAGAGLDPGTSVWAAHCSPTTSYLKGACSVGANGGDLGSANAGGGGRATMPAVITSGYVLSHSGPGLLRGGTATTFPGFDNRGK